MAQNHGYIGRSPGDSTVLIARQEYTASGVTTDFTFTSGYTVGYVDVYLNGARLIEATDYTATNGTSVVLGSGASADDVVIVVAYGVFQVADLCLLE